jgi:hypothetical protein
MGTSVDTNPVIESVNRLLLKPLGFERKGALFNRRRGEYVDVVCLPMNKAGDAVTLEVGVQHDGLYEALWEAPPPRFSNEASCIVHARIGALLEGDDLWWPIADPQSPAQAVKAVEGPVLRFLQGHHDLAAIAAELAKVIAARHSPRHMLYLAILRHRRGDHAGAAALFADLAREESGDWAQRAAAVQARLASAAATPSA